MSLPPELRVLCLQLSSSPPEDLPRLTPTLLRHVLRCGIPLSSPASNAGKADASATSVLVHKLKTQLSTLLNGRSSEGRFAAVVLIKAVIEVGGWEVLRGSEPWVRGLLSILGKADPVATKELCIVALTKIYCMTHQYQSLVREITTPTLPGFITVCLNLISSKASSRVPDVPSSLVETIFRSFTTLLPRHTTIYRPFVSQIRVVARPYLAPTLSDGVFVSPSLVESSRCLVVALHQTVAKNGGGEEWGKAVRDLVKDIHVTADHVFRAVVEDWESTTGYISESVDINQALSSGARTADDLPRWEGVAAGVERLVGLLGTLEEYFKNETSSPVSIPLGQILDMINRMLSIVLPSPGAEYGGARLHPAIDRDERDELWSGIPQVYVASLQLLGMIIDRLESNCTSIASGCLDQVTWIFPSGKSSPEFRQVAYIIVSKLLPVLEGSISKSSVGKLSLLIRSCCKDLQPPGFTVSESSNGNGERTEKPNGTNPNSNGANSNADSFLPNGSTSSIDIKVGDPALTTAASTLLPLFLSHLPQQYIDVSVRAIIDRTAILSHHKDTMLASIINPHIGKDGNATPSILPFLAKAFPTDDVVEILSRPRMAVLPSTSNRFPVEEDGAIDAGEGAMVDISLEAVVEQGSSMEIYNHPVSSKSIDTGSKDMERNILAPPRPMWGTPSTSALPSISFPANPNIDLPPTGLSSVIDPPQAQAPPSSTPVPEPADVNMDSDSDAESVHLTMQLDDLSDDDSS